MPIVRPRVAYLQIKLKLGTYKITTYNKIVILIKKLSVFWSLVIVAMIASAVQFPYSDLEE